MSIFIDGCALLRWLQLRMLLPACSDMTNESRALGTSEGLGGSSVFFFFPLVSIFLLQISPIDCDFFRGFL